MVYARQPQLYGLQELVIEMIALICSLLMQDVNLDKPTLFFAGRNSEEIGHLYKDWVQGGNAHRSEWRPIKTTIGQVFVHVSVDRIAQMEAKKAVLNCALAPDGTLKPFKLSEIPPEHRDVFRGNFLDPENSDSLQLFSLEDPIFSIGCHYSMSFRKSELEHRATSVQYPNSERDQNMRNPSLKISDEEIRRLARLRTFPDTVVYVPQAWRSLDSSVISKSAAEAFDVMAKECEVEELSFRTQWDALAKAYGVIELPNVDKPLTMDALPDAVKAVFQRPDVSLELSIRVRDLQGQPYWLGADILGFSTEMVITGTLFNRATESDGLKAREYTIMTLPIRK